MCKVQDINACTSDLDVPLSGDYPSTGGGSCNLVGGLETADRSPPVHRGLMVSTQVSPLGHRFLCVQLDRDVTCFSQAGRP